VLITGTTSGVTADGEEAIFRSVSHYFCTCDCEDEAVYSSAHQGQGSGFGLPRGAGGAAGRGVRGRQAAVVVSTRGGKPAHGKMKRNHYTFLPDTF
jgi:hypothetical protein